MRSSEKKRLAEKKAATAATTAATAATTAARAAKAARASTAATATTAAFDFGFDVVDSGFLTFGF